MERPTIVVIFPNKKRRGKTCAIVSKYLGQKGIDDWYWSRASTNEIFDTMEEAVMMLDMSNTKFPVFIPNNQMYVPSEFEYMAGSFLAIPSVIMNKTIDRYYTRLKNGTKHDFCHISWHRIQA